MRVWHLSCEVSVLFTPHQAPPLPSVKLGFIPFHTPLVVTSLAHTGRAKFTTLVHHVLGEGPALFIFSPTLPVTSETDFVRLEAAYLGGPKASLHLILVDIHLLRHAARAPACPVHVLLLVRLVLLRLRRLLASHRLSLLSPQLPAPDGSSEYGSPTAASPKTDTSNIEDPPLLRRRTEQRRSGRHMDEMECF